MELEFLSVERKKVVRTTLYGDQEFTAWELEVLHTPIMQRLYNLKQLGFADRVFPDAVHSRFNHVLGVAEMAERMANRLVQWLHRNETVQFDYVDERTGLSQHEWQTHSISGKQLAELVEERVPIVRLIGLLHDITHAAFGHTLEDEVCVFVEKHDEPARQNRFFNALVGQLLYLWTVEMGVREQDPDEFDRLVRLEVDETQVRAWAEELAAMMDPAKRTILATRLRELETAFALLSYIEFLHASGQHDVPPPPKLHLAGAIDALDQKLAGLDVVLHRDAFLVDIVGNTICADLLDYARRDASNAGLRVQFDERLIRYVCNVSVGGNLSPTGGPCIRIALQFFTDKVRYDVLSEMSGILKARYLINERVLFHPTKCAAGAMLGTAAQLLGIGKVPSWMQVMGDQEFLRVLVELARRMSLEVSDATTTIRRGDRLSELVSSCLSEVKEQEEDLNQVGERIKGARTVLWRLISRRYPKLVYRLRSGVHHGGDENDETIARKYTDPVTRFELEREVERRCNLPRGSLVVHCPKRKMSMKAAQALVVGSDLSQVAHLRDVNKITPEPLRPYNDEIKSVEEMYRAIWQLHAYLDSSQRHKSALVEAILEEMIHFPNDELLRKSVEQDSSSPYTLLAGALRNDFAWAKLTPIVRRLDEEGVMRMRHGKPETTRERTLRIIREVELGNASVQPDRGTQEGGSGSEQLKIFGGSEHGSKSG